MAILLNCNAIFLHVPKTAGNWVADVLGKNNLIFSYFGEKHTNMEQVLEFERWFRVAEKYVETNPPFVKFCFVRNPFGWYESFFKMQSKLNWPQWGINPSVWHPNAALDGLGSQNFDTFISNVLKVHPGYVTQLYGWYTLPDIDFVGRQENLVEDMIGILDELEIPFDRSSVGKVAPVNQSIEAKIKWNPELKEEVSRVEYVAFKKFGYESLLPWNENNKNVSSYNLDWRHRKDVSSGDDVYIPQTFYIEDMATERLQGPFVKEIGFAWRASLPQYESGADNNVVLGNDRRSKLVLLENGIPLWRRHTLHEEIRRLGSGRYSHWVDGLIFSTTDNSDPNTNGRNYQIAFWEE